MKILVTILLAMTLSACSMSREEIALETQKLAIMKSIAEKPTLKCTHGCEYTDPRRNLSAMFPKKTNGWDFANQVLRTATVIAPWVAVSNIAVKGIQSSGGNTNNTDSNNTLSEANQQTTSTISATDNNSINDSNNSIDDNSVSEATDDNSSVVTNPSITEPVAVPATP